MRTKTKSIIIPLFLSIIITSCVEKRKGEIKTTALSNFLSVTDNEYRGVREILDFYGGYCEYSYHWNYSSENGKTTDFGLELSKSEVIDKLDLELVASHIAFLFYNELKEEKYNYKHIRTKLIGNKSSINKYNTDTLEIVKNKISLLNQTINIVNNKNRRLLQEVFDSSVYQTSSDAFMDGIIKYEPRFGYINDFHFRGFKIIKSKNKYILHLSAMLIREKEDSEFSIETDLDISNDKIYKLDYQL